MGSVKIKIDPRLPGDFSASFTELASEFFPFAQERMGFDKPVSVHACCDPENAANPLGKTAWYDPVNFKIMLFADGRHIKDILRSLSHELVHHTQNCRGDMQPWLDFLEGGGDATGYAQDNEHMRELEREAYETGNLTFRDWEDDRKKKQKMFEGFCKKNNIPFNKKKLFG